MPREDKPVKSAFVSNKSVPHGPARVGADQVQRRLHRLVDGGRLVRRRSDYLL